MPQEPELGAFSGGEPYLALGSGRPLVYLVGLSPNHEVPAAGLERRVTLGTIRPFARAGYRVYLTNRPPGLTPGTSWADLTAGLADSLRGEFDGPVDVIGHSTGGSQALQLIADHPEVVRRAVVASAAYRLGPLAKAMQRELIDNVERNGRFYSPQLVAGFVRNPVLQRILNVPIKLATSRVKISSRTDLATALRAEDGFDVYDALPGIKTETLVIYGGRDHFWTQEMFAETAERMPNATGLCYPKAGHAIVSGRRYFADVINFLGRD